MAPKKGKDESTDVKIAIRFRGGPCKENADWKFYDEDTLFCPPPNDKKQKTFHRVFPSRAEQEDVYQELCSPLVQAVVDGYHATIFAYGQTGSGKTFSMFGSEDQPGMFPRAAQELVEMLEAKKARERVSYRLECSFVETLHKKAADLLDADKGASLIEEKEARMQKIRRNNPGRLVQVKTASDMKKLLKQGLARRSVAAHLLNADSSRTHAIFTIDVLQLAANGDDKNRILASLNFVDLCGSERVKKSGVQGEHLKQAGNINRDLSFLNDVVRGLVEKEALQPVFRNCNLTYFLQNALGGNCKAHFLITCSPEVVNVAESLHTLEFAQRALKLPNRAVKQEISLAQVTDEEEKKVWNELEDENAKLRSQLEELKSQSEAQVRAAERAKQAALEKAREEEAEKTRLQKQLRELKQASEQQKSEMESLKKELETGEITSVLTMAETAKQQGNYKQALSYYQQALRLQKEKFGDDHVNVAATYNSMGLTADEAGNYDAAREHFDRALKIQKSQLGEDHPSVAATMTNVAQTLQAQGKFQEAMKMHESALRIKQAAVGDDGEHASVGTSYVNMGELCRQQGKYEEALLYLEKGLQILRRTLSNEHASVATTLNYIGLAHDEAGQYGKAMTYYKEALGIQQELDDPSAVATTLCNMAGVCKEQGDLEQAMIYYEQGLKLFRANLGDEHPSVATALNNMAMVCKAQGQLDKARQYYDEALRIKIETLGEDHTSTAVTMCNMGSVCNEQGKFDEAMRLFEKALKIQKAHLGADHPTVATIWHNMGFVHKSQGSNSDSKECFETALQIRRAKLGENHPATQSTLKAINASSNGSPVSRQASLSSMLSKSLSANKLDSKLDRGLYDDNAKISPSASQSKNVKFADDDDVSVQGSVQGEADDRESVVSEKKKGGFFKKMFS